jgi:hypothetical protein
MDMLVPFHMLYADGVERLAAESLLERQKWVNRIWYVYFNLIQLLEAISDDSMSRQGGCQPPNCPAGLILRHPFPFDHRLYSDHHVI